VPAEKAFQQALGKTFEEMDVELKKYVKNNSYPSTVGHFKRKLEFDSEMESRPLGEADVQAYLGDLLLHSRRAHAEKYLQKAIELDANHAMGLSALGIFRMREGKSDEAKQLLQRAVAANAENFLTHYYYAEALTSEGMPSGSLGTRFSPETIKIMRAELQKAIQLAPTFPESYRLLAFVNMVAHEQLDESVAMLKKALTIVPGNQQIAFMLGQVYLNQQDFKSAKAILVPLAQTASEPELRASAKAVLDSLLEIEAQIARYADRRISEDAVDSSDRPRLLRPDEADASVPDSLTNNDRPRKFRSGLRAKRDGEEQARGVLLRIDCNAKGATFVVQTKDRVLKLSGGNMTAVEFVTYTADIAGGIGCGARNPANPVIITYRPPTDVKAKNDGETVAVEFIPKDFPDEP